MNQKPSNAFIAASWIALGSGLTGFIVGLSRAEMILSEKGYYFTILLYGLFAVISVQKSVRAVTTIRSHSSLGFCLDEVMISN